jgi:hypothetical protein
MWLEIDLGSLPPAIAVHEPENARELKAVVVSDGHGYIDQPTLRRLVEEAGDGALPEGYEAMLAFAAEHGWRREDGAIRVHLEQASGR